MITDNQARSALLALNDPMVGNMAADDVIQWAQQELARREWQPLPDRDGWYWIENFPKRPHEVKLYRREDGTSFWQFNSAGFWVHLSGRVCPINNHP